MLSLFKDKIVRRVLILGILLRVLVMPFLFHPDIKTYSFQTSFLGGGVFNIYSYLEANKKNLPLREDFVYQPLTYLTLGVWQIATKPLLGNGFNTWLWDASQKSVDSAGVFRYLFILKSPYLIFDVGIAFVLSAFLKDIKKKRAIFSLWMLNPITIIIIYAFSNVDVIPLFISLCAIHLAKNKKFSSAAILLGVASGFKVFPLLMLPILALSSKDVKEAVKIFLLGVGTFFITLIPFWSKSLVSSAVVSGLTTRIFLTKIDLGFGVSIVVPVVILFLVYLLAISKKYKIQSLMLVVFMMLFSFIHYHIQWIIWMLPFGLLVFIQEKGARLALLILSVFLFALPFLYDDRSMSVSLFSMISYYFTLVPIPFSIVQKFYDTYSLMSVFQSAIVALSVFTSWKILNYQK